MIIHIGQLGPFAFLRRKGDHSGDFENKPGNIAGNIRSKNSPQGDCAVVVTR